MTRRNFLKQTALAALGVLLAPFARPSLAEAGTGAIRYVRQMITAHPDTTRAILWQMDALPARTFVEYRRRGDATAVQKADPGYQYFTLDEGGIYTLYAVLDGLRPATQYEYAITTGSDTTGRIPFTTAPAEDGSFSALFFDDSQCADYSVWRTFFTDAFRAHGDAAFYADLGDLVDNGASAWQWREFLAALGTYGERCPLVPVMGNHECYGLDWKDTLPTGFLNTFHFPDNGYPGFDGYFYSFDFGPCHFAVLNTQFAELDGLKPGLKEAQLLFLHRTMASTTRPWRIVLMHKDILAYDEYQTGTATTGGFSDAGTVFRDAFDALGIDLVLTGHMHTYRNRGHIYAGKPAEKGPLYIMFGPAGDQRYYVPPDPLDKVSMDQSDKSNFRNYLYFKADPHALSLTALDEKGHQIDAVTLKK